MSPFEARLRDLPPAPTDAAPVVRLVARGPSGARSTPDRARLDPELGLVGDRWADGPRNPDAQVTLMRADVAGLLADDFERFGDNLFVSIDTSAANLPPGTRVRLGDARAVVTPKPHRGCAKFAQRGGDDALAVTRSPEWAAVQLRGVHLRVIEGGDVRVGDLLVVEHRPPSPG